MGQMNKLEAAIYDLLQTEPYFAHFVLDSRIVWDRFGVETAAAGVINGSPVLIFNSKFVDSLPHRKFVGLIKHEVMHLLLDHASRGKTMKEKQPHVAGIAMDVAINQHISPEDLPEGGCDLPMIKTILKNKNLAPFETGEYYYQALMEKVNEVLQSKADTTDDHDCEIEGAEKDAIQIKAAVQATSAKAMTMAKGNVSEHLSKLLSNLADKAILNWKQLLRNFISRAVSNTTQSTRKKTHRRFELDFPGKKYKRKLVLGVCTDSSGSVSDDDYTKFLTEIQGMLGVCSVVHLVHADCEVQKVEKLTKKKDLKRERHGNGGTAYGPALLKCKELKCDAIVYLGDMDCADVPNDPMVPVLWITVRSTTRPGNFGKMVELK